VDSVVSVERHSKRVLVFEDGLAQCYIKCSYGLCSSLRETRGGKVEFFESSVPFDELCTSE